MKLYREEIYLANGDLFRRTLYKDDGSVSFIYENNLDSGKTYSSDYWSNGNHSVEEVRTDGLESLYLLYSPKGTVISRGHKKSIWSYEVQYFDSVQVLSFADQSGKDSMLSDSKVGLWNYYYSNGKDSAIGNYAYRTSMVKVDINKEKNITFFIGNANNKDGLWHYYSPEGKLIREEEWNKGNLISRKTF